MKKIISLLLSLVLVALALVSCGGDAGTTQKEAERPNLTLKIGIVVDDKTTEAGIAAMQKKFNALSSVALSTQAEFVCVKASEYKAAMDAEMARLQSGGALSDLNDENAKAEATDTDAKVDLNAYPAVSATQFDLLVIAGEDMYREYAQNGWILSLNDSFAGTYKVLKTKVIDEAMEMLQLDGHCYAIPAAEAYGDYTYLKVNKKVLEACNIPVEDITDLASAYQIFRHLDTGDAAKGVDNYWRGQYESFSPVLNSKEDFSYVGVEYLSHDGAFSLIGTTYGVNDNHQIWYTNNFTSSFNLLDDPDYRRFLEMSFDFDKRGYFAEGDAEDCIIGIVKGDYGMRNEDTEDYMYVTLAMPNVERNEVFDSMLAVSAFTVNKNRSVEVLQELMTNATGAGLLNVMLYGDENENYSLNDGLVDLRVSYSYAMHPDYLIGNLAENAYPCLNYGHSADTYSNIHKQNADLKSVLFDERMAKQFENIDATEEGDWAKVDAFCRAVYEDLYTASDLAAFREKIDAASAMMADLESTDANVQLYNQLKGDEKTTGTLVNALFEYVKFRTNE